MASPVRQRDGFGNDGQASLRKAPNEKTKSPGERIGWIDIAKGLGIILVVVGHRIEGPANEAIYLFHMPLFFMLSGLVFRPQPFRPFAIRRAASLLLPYISFLIVLTLAEAMLAAGHAGVSATILSRRHLWDTLYGGVRLTGVFGTFWFVPCLLLTLLAHNAARRLLGRPDSPRFIAMMLVLLCAAYPIGTFETAWNLAVVPMGWFFLWTGELWMLAFGSKHGDGRKDAAAHMPVMIGAVAMAGAGLAFAHPFDMKFGVYGTVFFSVAAAIACSHLLLLSARGIGRYAIAATPLIALGRASLIILFLHRFLLIHLWDRMSAPAAIMVAIMVPLGVHAMLRRSGRISRRLLLGEAAERPAAKA